MSRRRVRWGRAGVIIAVVLIGAACSSIRPAGYTVRADFSRTVGLYPGSFVRELGIDIGSVTKVVNQGDHVDVTMRIDDKYALRPDVTAILVGNSVLGERYVQFTPAYLGGPRLPAGALVPISRTAVPVETDEVLRSLRRVLGAVDPQNARALVTNFAQLVAGQGQKLNELLGNAAGTLSVVANKSSDLGQLVDSLASLTATLRTRDATLSALVRDYDTVSGVLAGDQQGVDRTISQLSDATSQAAALLGPNLSGVEDDVSVLTTVGQTLDRNLDSLDTGLANAGPRLFAAAKRAYDPQHNWLPLNPQNSPAASSSVLAARVRDSLASVCRRLAGREPAMAPALAACGNPNSGFFDPILNLVPQVIAQIPGQSGPSTPAALTRPRPGPLPPTALAAFAAGLTAIPGLSTAQRSALSAGEGGTSAAPPPAKAPASANAPSLPPMPPLQSAPRGGTSVWGHVTSFFSHVFGGLL